MDDVHSTQPDSTRWAAVTGASSGIGRAYARALARRGYSLLITGRREALLDELAAELSKSGTATEVHVGDLSDPATAERLVALVSTRPVEVLVNNAGFGIPAPVAASDPGLVSAMVDVHVRLPLLLCRAVLPGMMVRGHGTIVNVGSLAGRVAVPGAATYVATKAFLERLSESIALEAAAGGVVVQALTPGYVRTDFHRDIEGYRSRQKSRGLVRWLDPHQVVDESLRAADRARNRLAARPGRLPRVREVVVIPGRLNRVLARLASVIPRGLIYRAAARPKPI